MKDDDPRHGTERGYQAGCKNFCCRKGHADYNAARRKARAARETPEHVHGTRNGYSNYGCHCPRCQVGSLQGKRSR